MGKVSVAQKEGEPEIPAEVIAQDIAAIAEGMRKMRGGRLNDRAIVTLIYHACNGVSRRDIVQVLDCVGDLDRLYLKKK